MKLRSPRHAAGLTLPELLVVIVIAVVVASFFMSEDDEAEARPARSFANEQERLDYERRVREATAKRQAHEAQVALLLKKETATCRATLSSPSRKGYSIAFSPDGSKIAAIYKYGIFSSNNQLRIWDAESGKQLGQDVTDDYSARVSESDAVISSSYRTIAFTPEGSMLAYFCIQNDDKRFIRLIDATTQKQVGELIPYGNNANTDERGEMLRFSPDGRQLAFITYSRDRAEPYAIHRWDVNNMQPCDEPLVMQERPCTIDFTADGENLLLTTPSKACRISLASRSSTVVVNSDKRVIFNHDGSKVAVWKSDSSAGVVRIHSLKKEAEPLIPPMRIETAKVLEFSPDGSMIATALEHESVYFEEQPYVLLLRDSVTGELIGKPMRHAACITAATFSPDGKTLATVDMDGNTKLWDVPEHEQEAPPAPAEAQEQKIPVSTEPLTEEQLIPLAGRELLRNATFSPDGSKIATITNGTDICFWDAATHLQEEDVRLAHEAPLSHVAFSPNGKVLATASGDLSVRLWDTQEQALKATLAHSHSVNASTFSPNGKQLATASNDGCVYLWDVHKATRIGKAMELQEPVSAVAFSPDGRMLAATGYAAPCARIWNPRTQALIGELKAEGQLILGSISFSPDGKTLAAPATDNTVRLWESATQRPTGKPLPHEDTISALAFSPHGHVLATLSGNSLRFWDTRSGQQIGEVREYTGSFHSLAFSPDGRLLACDDAQGCIIFHEVPAADAETR